MPPSPDPPAPPPWRPLGQGDPAKLGPYELLGRLGQGGMGTVYAAQAAHGRLVAVKVIRGDHSRRPELRERFRREVDAASRVAAFCTAPVLDADLDADVPYIVSEYVAGPTLDRVVRETGPLPASGLHALAVGMAGALAAIHAAGVVHRDLKPGNVLLGATGPRVIDFGIARADGASPLTTPGGSPGTPAFMAPELHEGQAATPAADVFAWGATIAFAGTGRPPFGGEGSAGTAYLIVYGEADLDGLAPDLRPLVASALAKDPAARPDASALLLGLTSATGDPEQAAGAVLTRSWPAVAGLATRTGVPVAPAPTTLSPSAFTQRRRRRRLAVAGGWLAGVLAIASIGIVASTRQDDPGPARTAPPTSMPDPPPELPGVELLLRDDFAVKANGWPERSSSQGDWHARYADGGYELTAGPGGGLYFDRSWIGTSGVQVALDVTFRAGNPRGGLVVRCPITVPPEGQPHPDDVAMILRADGAWEIVAHVDDYDYLTRESRVLRSGRFAAMRAGRANRLVVTCLPGEEGRKAAVLVALNGGKATRYDGKGLAGIGDFVYQAIKLSAPSPANWRDDPVPTTVLIDNVDVWGREG